MKLRPEDYEIHAIPSGLPQMDSLLGVGGYPRKYLTMISGNGGVGKSTLAFQAIVEAQKMGVKVLYVETDFKFVPHYPRSLGVDLSPSKMTIIQGEVGEDVLREMIEEASTGKYGLLVLDTISKITPREEVEKDFDSQTIGKQAILIGRFLRKLKPLAHQHNMAVILLNHERKAFMDNNTINTPGGQSIQEDVVIWARASHTGIYVKQGDEIIGKKIKVKIWRKNQVAPTEGKEAILEVRMGEGFSATADMTEAALEKGIITREGSHFFFEGEKICYGRPKLDDWVKENTERLQELIKGI